MSQVWTVKIVGRYYELLDENDATIHITADRMTAYWLEDICKRHNRSCQESDEAYNAGYKEGYTEGWNTACDDMYSSYDDD